MTLKKRNLLGGINRFRLMLTLVLAVLLPAAALIYVNFSQLRSFERDKFLQAAIHRDFQEALAITEKRMSKKAYAKVDDVSGMFPSIKNDDVEKKTKLEEALAKCACFDHAFIFDGEDLTFVTDPNQMNDRFVREEHDHIVEGYRIWFSSKEELKNIIETIEKKPQHMFFSPMPSKRADGPAYILTAFFALPDNSTDELAFGGISFDPCFLKNNFFPEMLAGSVNEKSKDETGNQLAMMIYRSDTPEGKDLSPIVATAGWDNGKPEVTRKMDDVFRGLSLAIKYQGVSVEALGATWMRRSFMILGFLSVMIIAGLVLTKHMVGKEMAVAKLKSDFVSNVSHELRTPLALIRLYAETLELGRITTKEKKQQYYRIIRKESERLTALINNILDFSRIEAGRKEYEFRETDIANLVRNTIDSYRYQIEQQGFALEETIDDSVPPVKVDREAIARALVNLVNNALKYSRDEKYLGVKLYRENGAVKLEVADKGIGIARRDQGKIFEKFYRAGDPLVHNTKGSGLGLSLVRHITEAHGGDISVESAPGAGSKFTLSLPLMAAPEIQPQATAATAH
ncbi:MAG TPA: HAMP domain-containing sensor histidine kinase [Pyrinomonadaceae bacterium]|nr:HAMP domain-containing sensor histidine kinase [Pyrinomonadaceae bacterium]